MSNPDTSASGTSGTRASTSAPSVSINALSTAIPAGVILFIITVALFHFKESIPSFTIVLWISIPVIAFLLTAAMNLASQYMYCKDTDSGKAFMGAIPSLFAVLIGLAVSSFSICRIPVASVAIPFFTPETPTNAKNSTCCAPSPTLESIEATAPMVTGLSYGFYLFFSMLFGIVIGSGTAVVC